MNTKVRNLVKGSTLCNNNLQVKFYLQELKKKLKKLGVSDESVLDLINDSQEVLRVMKKQGQNMENRMRAYHDSVISLGFVRKHK